MRCSSRPFQIFSDLFTVSVQGDDIQDFDTRWDQALSSASETPKENILATSEITTERVLEALYNLKIRGSVQLQTVLPVYYQEIDRNLAMRICQRLKTTERRNIDQMTRTRNFKAWNERVETGVLVKNHKGRNVSTERQVGDFNQWKATGQCSREDSCNFSHGSYRGHKAQSSSLAPKAQTQIDGRKPTKGFGLRGEIPSGRKGQTACKKHLKGKCTNPSCDYWHPPVCQNYKSVSGCEFGGQYLFRHTGHFKHTETGGQPSKKSKKSDGEGSVALLTESVQLACVSQDYPQKISLFCGKVGKLGSNHTVTFSQGTWHHKTNRERKCPSQGIMQKKSEPQERNPCAPKFEDRTLQETLQ